MGSELPDLIPARMLNEHVYCPRLAYLEWADHLFASNAFTEDGSFVHRRVDRARGKPPDPAPADAARPVSTSVALSSQEFGLTAVIDLLESDGGFVVPVEYKRGRPKSESDPVWEPERVQLCAQVLLLRACGYDVEYGEVYFAETRTRHRVVIDQLLIETTERLMAELRRNASRSEAPPPLIDSPKCDHCSLSGLCLPDELNLLSQRTDEKPRRLIAGASPATPLYASTPGSRLSKRSGRAVLTEAGNEVATRRLIDISHVAVFGNVDMSSGLIRALLESGTPVLWLSSGGWLQGYATGANAGNARLRMCQFRAASTGPGAIASAFVAGKVRNSRTLIRRHGGDGARPALAQLAKLAIAAEGERDPESLLGIEGTAARIYFGEFGKLLKGESGFEMEGRNRRPPTDPVNALLSFAYALLVKDVSVALVAAGLDPYIGMYHRLRFGRPGLALDLAEEFRPLVADSVVLKAINNGEVNEHSFVQRAGAVALTKSARRAFIGTYERRMREELTHPRFRYRASYRRTLEIQARLLAAVFLGEIDEYRSLTTR